MLNENENILEIINMQIPITERLKTVAEMIGETDVLCDIGCDHGYLPIYLLQQNKIKKAYACDLRDGPLKTALKNIAAFHMKDMIQTIKSDGLKELGGIDFDVISICGMGGRLIAEILEASLEIAKRAKYMVLQPQSEIPVLRKFLAENGFLITEERIAVEDRRFYVIMSVSKGVEPNSDEMSLLLGRKLLESNDSFIQQYLKRELARFQKILEARGGENQDPQLCKAITELKKYV
ncbi:MAG: SAM-dependent methyltransferase [Ruminococcaceae bacterium]|nr:SAM-dependent methyltransferase [Oscillospiraceae bacterium]